MADSTGTTQTRKSLLSRGARLAASIVEKGAGLSFSSARGGLKTLRLANLAAQGAFEAGVSQPFAAVLDANQLVTASLVQTLRGERRARDFVRETADRVRAGSRFAWLAATLGKELFGSARYPGEAVLAEDEHLRLTFIPPKETGAPAPFVLFHAGGGIPYGEQLFRFLPEASFYERFRERGVPVYAMELRGDRRRVDGSGLTMERLAGAIERFSSRAFEHAGRRKMVLEGYCGHGMHAMAYVAARPRDAEEKFLAAALFVAPVDGTQCSDLGDMMQRVPEPLLDANLWMWGKLGGYVPVDSLRTGLDLSLRTIFPKTPMGAFLAGWKQPGYAGVERIADLSPAQRKELAGAYWLSRENADRFAIPVDLARFAGRLFTRGISASGEIPFTIGGRPLSLRDVAQGTRLQVVGIYGGKDAVVQDRTAYPLMAHLGERYTHVVHPDAGHVSYILSPGLWDEAKPGALRPNPIEVIARVGGNAKGV